MSEQTTVETPANALSQKEKNHFALFLNKEIARLKTVAAFREQVKEWVDASVLERIDFQKMDLNFSNREKISKSLTKFMSAFADAELYSMAIKSDFLKPEEAAPVVNAEIAQPETVVTPPVIDDQLPKDDNKREPAPEVVTDTPAVTPKAESVTPPAKADAKEGELITPDTSLTIDRPYADVKKEANKLVKSLSSAKSSQASAVILDLIAITATSADEKERQGAGDTLNILLDCYRAINYKMYRGLLNFIKEYTHLKIKADTEHKDEFSRRGRWIVDGQKENTLKREFKGFYSNGTLYRDGGNGKNVFQGLFFTTTGGQGKGDLFIFTDHFEDFAPDAISEDVKKAKKLETFKKSVVFFIDKYKNNETAQDVIDALAEKKAENIETLEKLLAELKASE